MFFYLMFIFILDFSYEKVGQNGEHDIIYFNEYDITKNTYNNKVTAGSRLTLIMKYEEDYDLEQLTIRFKFSNSVTPSLNIYLCNFYPDYFTKSDCDPYNYPSSHIELNNDDYKIYQYYIENTQAITGKSDLKYIVFSTEVNSEQKFFSIFVFPLKIFNLTDSNELNIHPYYSNSSIPKSTCFFIRVNQNLTEANMKFTILHNSNFTLDLKLGGVRRILTDEEIKKKYNYELNAVYLKTENNGIYDNYFFNIESTSEKPYIVFLVELYDSLDYLSVSIIKDKSKESDIPEHSDIPINTDTPENSEKSKDSGDDSNSPVLIIIISILSCVILIGIGYYLYKRYKKKSEIEQNFITPKNNIGPILTPLRNQYKGKD